MKLIPGYSITEHIYESRRSTIYRALRESDGRRVVLKLNSSEYPTPDNIARLRREYRVTRGLRAANVIEVLSFDSYRNHFAIVMEDIGGESLSSLQRGRPMELPRFLDLAIQLAETLGEVHQCRVIHKDINPGNIVWNPSTGGMRLIDFGIAAELPTETSALLSPHFIEGTLAFMSPEQTGRMNRIIDYRTDFYSLGVTFYELLTGELPFPGDDPLGLVHCHIAKTPRAPHELNPRVPPVLSEVVLKLMAKHAEERYQSGFALKADLREIRDRLDAQGRVEAFSIGRGNASDQFQLPQKLYGRERERQALLEAFERVSAGGAETMFVAGYSGIGKSALIHEVHRPIARRRGYFVSGKFDQFQRNIPYASLRQAFREMVRQLLTEPPEQLARWRERILTALGPNAQVIIDVIREVELIIGKQPPVPELSPREEENRLQLMFERFFCVFGGEAHPLVIFLDDLQWADLPSLKLLEQLMGDPRTRYVYFIGAYRDNEVDGQHPLLLTQAALRRAGARLDLLTLGPLSHAHCVELLCDTLLSDAATVEPVAELCVRRTGGNPFFLSQYLLSLHREQLFEFDGRRGRWRWKMDKLLQAPMADNVVDLMAGKILLLEEGARRALQLAACIGSTFDLATLAVVNATAPETAAAALWPAMREGLVVPLGESYKFTEDQAVAAAMLEEAGAAPRSRARAEGEVLYRFLHDRVQQAAYSLVPETDRPALHLTVGRLLREATPPEALDARLFSIVNQLNAGAALIHDDAERLALAQRNLAAARKAKHSAAHSAALAYSKAGIQLLDEHAWTRHHALALELHLEAAEASYLSADASETERYIETVIAHAADLFEKARAYEIRIQSLTAQSRMVESLKMGAEILRLLGIEIPEHAIDPPYLMAAFEAVQRAIGGRSVEQLAALPTITDPHVLASIQFLTKMTASSFVAKPELFPIVVLRQVRLALEHGNTGACAFGYTLYGLLRIAIRGDIEGGHAFGRLAVQLLERYGARQYETRTRACTLAFITHWREPLRATVEAFTENYRAGFETGDIEYAAWSGKHATVNAYFMGEELGEVQQMAVRYIETLTHLKQNAIVQYLRTQRQVTESLMGDDPEPWQLNGPGYNFNEVVAVHRATQDASGVCWAFVHRLIVCRLFGRIEEARAAIAEYEAHLGSTLGMAYIPVENFFASLTWISACDGASEEVRQELLSKVDANQRQLAVWAEHAPWNRACALALVDAEAARVRGNAERARDSYYRAMALSREHGNRREEALATELFAHFLLGRGEEEMAQFFMAKASHLYELWGAMAKARDLKRRFPTVLRHTKVFEPPRLSPRETALTTTSREKVETIDLLAVLRASQAISGEVILPELLRRIMLVMLQNAGARRGLLLIGGARPLMVEVNAAAEATPRIQIHEGTVNEREDASRAIIRYVERTREQVVLVDAVHEGAFRSDPDVLRNQSRSILCLPILRNNELDGVLYLENELTAGAFTPEHCQVLQLLASQAAISLENARLYETLENQVQRRTRELMEALENLRGTQRQLVAQEKLASLGLLTSGIAHELKNPLNFVLNFADTSTQLVDDLRDEFSKVSPRLGEHAETISLLMDALAQNTSRVGLHGKRADGIVRSMLQHAGGATLQRAEVKLNRLVHDSVRMASEAFLLHHRGFQMNVETELSDALPPVYVSAQELRRVVINLMSNACYTVWERAKLAGSSYLPTVRIITRDAEAHVEVRVLDNGLGIAAAHQEKIFIPFFTTKPPGEGTGLGLSLSHDIVVGHNGTLEFTTHEGEGTEFVVRLPKQRAPSG